MNGFLRRPWAWAVISAVVLFVCWLSTGWQPPPSRTRTALLSSTDGETSKAVFARGWVQSNHVNAGEKVHFWITFVNASDHEIHDLRLLFLNTPGFEPAPPCWTTPPHPLPSCFEGTPTFPTSLKPGASATLLADLKATSLPGRYGLSVVFGWKNPQGERERKALLLGPIEVTYSLADNVFPITQKVYAVGKDFGLPFAVAVLTFFFGTLEQKRKNDQELAEEKRRKDQELAEQRRKEDLDFAEKRHKEEQAIAEEIRRDQQKLDDERRAQIQQTWSRLLQKHLKDSQLHYLPICSKLTYLRNRALRQPPEERECFYWLMTLMRRIKYTSDAIGGVHLKSQLAEETFIAAWATLRDLVERRLGKTERSRALDQMRPHETLAEFERRFTEPDALFAALESKFGQWLQDSADPFGRYLCLIWIMLLVLEFETNRPFEYWYGGTVLDFPRKDLDAALLDLKVLPSEVASGYQLQKYLEDYTQTKA